MKTRSDLLAYARSVHRAIHGEDLLVVNRLNSDHPYDGYNIDLLKELVDPILVKKQIQEFEKDLKNRVENLYSNLEIGTPVKVTKGSKEKRGLEGFILHAQDPLQGSGKALFVYDVLTNNSCMVRDSATKPRLPKAGERDLLNETYQLCRDLTTVFKKGTRVGLKSDPTKGGYCTTEGQLDPNFNGNGFHSVVVQWDEPTQLRTSVHILTELILL